MASISDLVAHMKGTQFRDLPQLAVDAAKRSILDVVACAIAGSSAEGIERLVRMVGGWGGKPDSTILVYGGKIPSPAAALVNSTMSRALDLDDVHERTGMHSSATMVPSALILSEYSKIYKGKVVNGQDLILAVALGSDLACRWRMAGGRMATDGGFCGETFNTIPLAAMGAKMLGLDEEKMLDAMGLAFAQSAGNRQAHLEGSLSVRLQQGLSSQAGILSVLLAQEGFTGARRILDGQYGFYSVYTRGEYLPEQLFSELGKRFENANISTKPYPSCKCTHGAIYGALQLASEHRINADSIKQVIVYTASNDYIIAGEERKMIPKTVPDAQFSIYYTVAAALVRGKVFIEDFTEEAIRNPEVISLSKKVKVAVDSELENKGVVSPKRVEIITNGGKRYATMVEVVKGHPDNPMTMSECVQKLNDCARFSAKPLPKRDLGKIAEMVGNLETLDDATKILEHIS